METLQKANQRSTRGERWCVVRGAPLTNSVVTVDGQAKRGVPLSARPPSRDECADFFGGPATRHGIVILRPIRGHRRSGHTLSALLCRRSRHLLRVSPHARVLPGVIPARFSGERLTPPRPRSRPSAPLFPNLSIAFLPRSARP